MHGGRNGCLKGTCRAFLDDIEHWTRDFHQPPVYYLNGLAGTGKSTIAQTIAERVFADGHLGASFFCSRDFKDRSDLRYIFPTLAVQLARRYTKFRSILVPLVRSDPAIAYESLYQQMEKLIVQPLRDARISTVIIIDGLDECREEGPASAILSVLGHFISKIPRIKFFITSRPDRQIREEGLRLPLLTPITEVFRLRATGSGEADNDIRLFFLSQFAELKRRRSGLADWPTEEQLNLLCERAAGLFVYAVVAARFIGRRSGSPRKQLDLLLQSSGNGVRQWGVGFGVNESLNSLYISVLQQAFGDDDLEDDPKIRVVLGAVALAANSLSPSTIATLLGLDPNEVFSLLSLVQSFLIIPEDVDHPVRPFHRSFLDFVVDPHQCTDQRFHVSPPDHHPRLLIGCLQLMEQRLEKNMCRLPDAIANSEVDDLKARAERYVDPALRYACESWHKHLIDSGTTQVPEIVPVLHRFLERKFIFWLEVLSALFAIRDAIDALEAAANSLEVRRVHVFDVFCFYSSWTQPSPTLDLVSDYSRFVTGFFEVISTSAPHIYHSALPLSPGTSIVRRLYGQYAHPFTRIVRGVPTSWDPTLATTRCSYLIWRTVWSSCGKFIAVRGFDSTKGIQILDAVTLKQLQSFADQEGSTQLFAISTGSHLLTWLGRSSMTFISWDFQTGGKVGEIPICAGRSAREARSITYSACGKMFGVLFKGRNTPAIGTCRVAGASMHYHLIKGSAADVIWTHSDCVRFPTFEPLSVTIWEVPFSSDQPPREVESLPTPDGFDPSGPFVFLPTLSRLAFTLEQSVLVWDAQHSNLVLNSGDIGKPGKMAFSSDGLFFACGTDGPEIHLWKDSPAGYIPHRMLLSGTGDRSIPREPLFSPDGQSIVVSDGSMLRLWRTEASTTTPSNFPTRAPQSAKRFILGFSPDGSLAAIARSEDETVTVLDLKTGSPRFAIDTGVRVHGLRVAKSTVVIVGDGKIITWGLPVEHGVLDVRLNVGDSVRKATLDHTSAKFPSSSISPNLNHIAVVEPDVGLRIYDTSSGKHLVGADSQGDLPLFTADGDEVWCHSGGVEGEGWVIIKDRGSDVTKLESLDPSGGPPGGFPWQSPRGYTATEGWMLSHTGRRLLWLPPHWRSGETDMVWGGRFLALLHPELPEAVVLELLHE